MPVIIEKATIQATEKKTPKTVSLQGIIVESAGIEPASKQDLKGLSTSLVFA